MQAIAKFEKVSYEQFEKDWEKNMGGSKEEIKAIYDSIKLPHRATKQSAGYDFYAPVDITMNPEDVRLIPTGIRAKIDDGYVLMLYPRSSLGFKYRMQLNNTVGVIDADYYNADNEGHIMCKFMNDSRDDKHLLIEKGQGMVQGIFMSFGVTVDDDANDERTGGIGSTTKQKEDRHIIDEKRWQEIDEKEPIPSHILERMEYLRKKHKDVIDDEWIKRPSQIEGIRKAGEINTGVLDEVGKLIHEGMSTQDIDDIVSKYTAEHGGICAPLNYEGFPKSVCTSINGEVCHGIPARHRKLRNGDIINVDCTTILDGYYADASRMFMIGNVSEERRRLVEETKKCLEIGIQAAQPWAHVGDIGYAIAKYAHSKGYSVVRELGGHGVGIDFHEDPFVAHVGSKGKGMVLVPGMIITIEPMINAGKAAVEIDPYNNWTIYTRDGSDSAQWEHTILITEDGNEILTY